MESSSGSAPASRNHRKKITLQDIELVHDLIERCLVLYMNKDEVVQKLLRQTGIEPEFTAEVWQKLEEENADFFKAYYIRLELKNQMLLFNHLVEQHNDQLMKCPMPAKVSLPPIQNGIPTMPVNNPPMEYPMLQHPPNNLPVGYPMLQHPPIPATVQPHTNSTGCDTSSCHVVNGVPTPSNFQPAVMTSNYDMLMDYGAPDMVSDIDLQIANEYLSRIKHILNLP